MTLFPFVYLNFHRAGFEFSYQKQHKWYYLIARGFKQLSLVVRVYCALSKAFFFF